MAETGSNKSKTEFSGINIATVIITTSLLLTLIIFFAAYSIANNKNLTEIKNNYDLETTTENNSGNIKRYSYFNNDENEKIISNKEEESVNENNITGEVEISRDNFLKKNLDDPIGGFSDPLYDSMDDDNKDETTNENKVTNNSNQNKSTSKTNKTYSKPITTTKQRTTTKANYPQIYNIKSYDKKKLDPYISDKEPYIIQIATHNYLKSAQHIRDILILEHFNAYILDIKFENKAKYRIRIGPFETKTKAVNSWKRLVKESKIKDVDKSIILVKK